MSHSLSNESRFCAVFGAERRQHYNEARRKPVLRDCLRFSSERRIGRQAVFHPRPAPQNLQCAATSSGETSAGPSLRTRSSAFLITPQAGASGFRYHALLTHHKENPTQINTCCEGQGARVIGSLPGIEFMAYWQIDTQPFNCFPAIARQT
jgi:hypothetical protein